jgi:hypothetical protein
MNCDYIRGLLKTGFYRLTSCPLLFGEEEIGVFRSSHNYIMYYVQTMVDAFDK